jgi:HK97 family phage portal protein
MLASYGSVRPTLTRDGSLMPPPSMLYGLPGPYVWDTSSARRIPAVARAIQLYAGMTKQMRLDVYRGYNRVEPTPRLVSRPDPLNARSWYVHVSVEDYLLNGNAISYVTSRGFDGWPLSVMWLPAAWVYILWTPGDLTSASYYYAPAAGAAVPLDPADVIHVKRGADRSYPVRGVGIVEEALTSLDRVAMEEEYERATLNGAAVPSVAVIAPQAQITQEVADEAKASWTDNYGGPSRTPAILPAGTQVVPLAWSPSDTQLIEARKSSLQDVANIFNLDGYWLGAPVAGMTYRTAGPQYQQIVKTSLEPVLVDFEDVWSDAWLPRGNEVRFDRTKLLRDDLATTAAAVSQLVGQQVVAIPEARVMLGLPPTTPADLAPATPPPPALPPAPTQGATAA